MMKLHRLIVMLLLAGSFVACQVKRPEIVLPDNKMEDVLYDYHIAKAMGEELSRNEYYKRVLYIDAVFKKHGITEEVFDSSMVWYAHNPEALTKIYEKVNTRLKRERDGVNHLIAMRDNKPKTTLPGDSIDIWSLYRMYLLTGTPLDNKLVFSIPGDSNFEERDTIRWSVRFKYPVQRKDSISPLMSMQIVYDKDSVVSAFKRVEKEGLVTLGLSFIYFSPEENGQTLLLDNIRMVRYHAKDSLAVDSVDAQPAKAGKTGMEKKKTVDKPVQPAKIQPAKARPATTPSRPVRAGNSPIKRVDTPVKLEGRPQQMRKD